VRLSRIPRITNGRRIELVRSDKNESLVATVNYPRFNGVGADMFLGLVALHVV
jgi:hypothetical protein